MKISSIMNNSISAINFQKRVKSQPKSKDYSSASSHNIINPSRTMIYALPFIILSGAAGTGCQKQPIPAVNHPTGNTLLQNYVMELPIGSNGITPTITIDPNYNSDALDPLVNTLHHLSVTGLEANQLPVYMGFNQDYNKTTAIFSFPKSNYNEMCYNIKNENLLTGDYTSSNLSVKKSNVPSFPTGILVTKNKGSDLEKTYLLVPIEKNLNNQYVDRKIRVYEQINNN